MDTSQDIRLNILRRIERENRGTAEYIANEFLATTHHDLGTIKRAVIDLLDDGYIRESNLYWPSERKNSVVEAIDTNGPTETKKNPKRLLDQKDIKLIRLYITLKGKRFLIEEENLRRTTWSIKYDIPLKLAFMVLGFLLTIGGYYLRTLLPKHKSEHQAAEQLLTPSDTANGNQVDSANALTE